MESRFIERRGGFRTHILEWRPHSTEGRLPVICIHGNLSNARMFGWIGEELSSGAAGHPRHVVALDVRGCGDSTMPEAGFALEDLASDIEAVLDHLDISEAHVIAYSRGVAYALQFASQRPSCVQGLVVGDYPPQYRELTVEWAEKIAEDYRVYDSWDRLYAELSAQAGIGREEFEARKEEFYTDTGSGIRKRYDKELPGRLQRESANHDLTPALGLIGGELLVLKGAEAGSLLSEEALEAYQSYHPVVERVKGAGHDVFEPGPQVREALAGYFRRVR